MSTKTPARSSKRTRSETHDDTTVPATPTATAAVVPLTGAKSSKKSKTTKSTIEEVKEEQEEHATSSTKSTNNSSTGITPHLITALATTADTDAVNLSTQLRTIQQFLLKISSTDPSSFLQPQLWPAFLHLLKLLQPNTVRIDSQVLTAIGRTITEMISANSFTLLPTIHQLLLLLLPSSHTPIAESWSNTFRLGYDFFIGFMSGVVRQLVALSIESTPESFYQLMATIFDSYMVINSQQTQQTQRKSYDVALQERSLPMWSQLHQQIQGGLITAAKDGAKCAAMSTCADQIEASIGAVLFHAEHLSLYADALGTTNEEEAAAEAEEANQAAKEAQQQAQAEGEDVEMKDEQPTSMEENTDAAEQQPSKKVKIEAGAKSATAKSKPKAAVPQQQMKNYTKQLFDSIQKWLAKDDTPAASVVVDKKSATEVKPVGKDKKRKHSESASSASESSCSSTTVTYPFTSRAIRAALPLLFAGYIHSSNAQFQLAYPSSASHPERETLTASEQRRKQLKEQLKTSRELQFLQRIWTMNESDQDVYGKELTLTSLPLLYDIFSTNAKLFQLIDQYDIYKIHQDTNQRAGSSTTTLTGFKKILSEQIEKVMKVALKLLQAAFTDSKAAEKKSSKSKAASSATTISTPALLSLASTLSSNILHLLQLNPEFITKYLIPESDDDDSQVPVAKINIWHFIWLVIQLSETHESTSSSVHDSIMVVFSPPTSSLSTVRVLSQTIFKSFFKLRQYDIIFNSYLHAARTAASLNTHLKMTPFNTVCGPSSSTGGFDLGSLIRNIPPLKVPNLWEWFLTQCGQQFASTKYSEASTESFVYFFVYFLDSIMIREEIAVQLRELYLKSIDKIIKPQFDHLKQTINTAPSVESSTSTKKKSKKAADEVVHMDTSDTTSSPSLASSSLFLLLHSLNEVKAQCDQHTEKTYETMLKPLPPYFHMISEGKTKHESTTSTSVIKLTDIIANLSHQADTDPILLHSLHLISLQRLQQLSRFQSRNIIINRYATDEDGDQKMLESDSDDDDEQRQVKAAKNAAIANAPKAQTRAQEAQVLTSFILARQTACDCYAATDSATHASYRYDGAVASLPISSATSAVALWHLICSHLDVLSQFATDQQRIELVTRIINITACRYCRAASLKTETVHGVTENSANASSSTTLFTLASLTNSLLTQPWFYEIASLRSILMDVALSKLISAATECTQSLDKSIKKQVKAGSGNVVKIPVGFTLTTALSTNLANLTPFADYFTNHSVTPSTSSTITPQFLWETLWLLQFVHAFPSQYLLSNQQFHVMLMQVLWSLETTSSSLAPTTKKEDKKKKSVSASSVAPTLSLRELASTTALNDSHLASLYSHLFLACRHLTITSVSALTQVPSNLALVFTPGFVEWFAWKGFHESIAVLQDRHRLLAQDDTRKTMKLVTPYLLTQQSAAASTEEKSKKKSTSSSSTSGSVLLPLIERISTAFSSPSSHNEDLDWSLRLSSSISESFVPNWSTLSPAAVDETLGHKFKLFTRDAGSIITIINEWTELIQKKLIPFVLKHKDANGFDLVFELYSSLLISYYASHTGDAKKETASAADGPKVDDTILDQIEPMFQEAVRVLTTASSTGSHAGALTFLQALSILLPLLAKTAAEKSSINFRDLFQALFQVLSTDISTRLSTSTHASSTVTIAIQSSLLHLQAHGSVIELDQLIEFCLQQLDPSFISQQPSSTSLPNMSASLQCLQIYLSHAHTPTERRAMSHSRLSLLFFRLGSLTSNWSYDILSHTPTSSVCLSLVYSTLQLLSKILIRHQVYSLDDQAMALLIHSVNQAAHILRDEDGTGSKTLKSSTTVTDESVSASSASSSILYQPLYLVLYTLLKYHATSIVKIIPIYLGLLKIILAYQWRQIQLADSAHPLSILTSQNLARLLEELGRSTNAKLFNKYLVGLLLDWIQISKSKGARWGQAHQEAHQKTIQKGWFAIINLCEDHDLSYLHNLLDPVGRAIFRTLHQAYKKTRFTGQV